MSTTVGDTFEHIRVRNRFNATYAENVFRKYLFIFYLKDKKVREDFLF